MYTIKKLPVYNADRLKLNNVLWGYDEYKPEVFAQISYDDEGFIVKFTIGEKDPKKTKTQHFESVHLDSCVEFFVNFKPSNNERYFNFETNANGVMNVAFRKNRDDFVLLSHEDVNSFNITPVIFSDHWEVSYEISFEFIKKYINDFDITKCHTILGNLYKCGDDTKPKHYISWNNIGCNTPDFHKPEFFAELKII